MKRIAILAASLCMAAGLAMADEVMQPGVHFVAPQDGATVGQEIKVVMAVEGMVVQPAGEAVDGAGHHHLIVDGSFVAEGETVPKDDTHFHFGKGQSDTTLHLTPGDHTLTLQFANGVHSSYGEAMSQTITIHVR